MDRRFPALLAVTLLLLGCSGGGSDGKSGGNQAVKLLSSTCASGVGTLPNSRCLLLEVEPSNLDQRNVELRIIEPAVGVPYIGTVVLGTGADGSTFYSSLPGGVELITDLTGIGLRVMERRWISGWLTPGFQLKSLSERYAVLLDWIHANEHQGGLFFAVGNSGGSGEIAFALTTWNRETLLDGVVLGAGPPFTRLDYLCQTPTAPWSTMCPGLVPPLECGVPPCMGPNTFGELCFVLSSMTASEQQDNSVLHPGADTDFGNTELHFVFGAADCTEWAPQAFLFESAVSSPHTMQLVPGTPHIIPTTQEGRDAIVQALLGFASAPPATAENQPGLSFTLLEDGEPRVTVTTKP